MATRFDTVKRAVQLAIGHRKAIANGNFAPFLPAFAMAITKDGLFDVVAAIPVAGLVGTFLGLFITVYLFIFLFGKGKWKVRIVIFILGFFDIIPVIGVIPFSTACVAYVYYQAKKHADQSEKDLAALEAQINAERIREYQMIRASLAAGETERQAQFEQEAANDPAYQDKKVRLVA